MNKRIALVVVLVVVVAAGVLVWRRTSKSEDPGRAKYRTEKVDRAAVTMTVTATGTLSAVTTVQIGSQVSGVIARLEADFNSPVRKGQLLAELDPTPFQAQVEQRRADLTSAQVDLRNAEIQLRRQKRLAQDGLTAESDLDSAIALFDSSRAQVQQATAALSQAETNLRYTRIISPVDGVVVDRQYDVGQTVAASFQAPTLFTIAQDLKKMQVQADVDQSDIGRIELGQIAHFTVDAYAEEDFEGKVVQVRLNATVNQNVVTYPVIIEVDNSDERLRPTMTANVTVDVAAVPDVLRVPNAALRFRPEPAAGADRAGGASAGNGQGSAGRGASADRAAANLGERGKGLEGAARGFGQATGKARKPGSTVYVLRGKEPAAVTVLTGISDGRFTEVKSGDLKEGDEVIVGLATTKVEQTGGAPGSRGPRMGRF